MPTYRNDGTSAQIVDDLNGKSVSVDPGNTIETYEFKVRPDFIKLDDDPLFNPNIVTTIVSHIGMAGDEELILDPETMWIRIWKVVSATIIVFLQVNTNLPSLVTLQAGDSIDYQIGGRAEKLILNFSLTGSCQVIESKVELGG